mmetsp:Transcript_85780/g.238832  ORF Transcript_85780/g.238832 Transcript_85780/m.238832 type:complete len:105 (+) Transcript_85780:1092-1406(+)
MLVTFGQQTNLEAKLGRSIRRQPFDRLKNKTPFHHHHTTVRIEVMPTTEEAAGRLGHDTECSDNSVASTNLFQCTMMMTTRTISTITVLPTLKLGEYGRTALNE